MWIRITFLTEGLEQQPANLMIKNFLKNLENLVSHLISKSKKHVTHFMGLLVLFYFNFETNSAMKYQKYANVEKWLFFGI